MRMGPSDSKVTEGGGRTWVKRRSGQHFHGRWVCDRRSGAAREKCGENSARWCGRQKEGCSHRETEPSPHHLLLLSLGPRVSKLHQDRGPLVAAGGQCSCQQRPPAEQSGMISSFPLAFKVHSGHSGFLYRGPDIGSLGFHCLFASFSSLPPPAASFAACAVFFPPPGGRR